MMETGQSLLSIAVGLLRQNDKERALLLLEAAQTIFDLERVRVLREGRQQPGQG